MIVKSEFLSPVPDVPDPGIPMSHPKLAGTWQVCRNDVNAAVF